MSDPGQTGCELPEDLRCYYLDVMGIQPWVEQVQPDGHRVEPVAATHTVTGKEARSEPAPEPRHAPAVDAASWQMLEDAVASCEKCALHQSRTQTGFGTGSHAAQLLIIGEAPGRDEDLQGEPFVGRAGQLLNAMLAAIGFQREQVYIANILKCRPPNNRDPEPGEAAQCNDWLQRQVEYLQPRVILALGRIAAHNLLNTDKALGELRRGEHQYAGIPVVVSYHPAYLLRKPIEKRKSWQDLKRVKRVLHGSTT